MTAPFMLPVTSRLREKAAGFTLLETLVVLVLVGLITGVLFTSFDQMLTLRLRLAAFLQGVDRDTIAIDWVRRSMSGLVADLATSPNRFVGDAHHFSGLSVDAPEAAPGVPVLVQWKLSYDSTTDRTTLFYSSEAQPPLAIASWTGDRGGFVYAGSDLVWADKWPRQGNGEPQLPSLVRLDAPFSLGDVILASPRAGKTSRPLPSTAVLQ